MARQRRVSRAELLRQACEESYDGFGTEQIKEEIARLNKIRFSQIEEKKVLNKAHGDLIKETTDKIEYLVEKLDAVRHEEAVANATQG